MYQKRLIEELVTLYSDKFKKALGIKKDIVYHVVSSQTKKYKKLNLSNADISGLSLIATNGRAEIFIFYDKVLHKRDAVATIFHELLHVRLYKLTGLLTINSKDGYKVEEDLVRDVETLFMSFWYDQCMF